MNGSPASTTGSIDILLVEDNPGDVRLIEEAFDAIETDTTVHAVSDGTGAIELLTVHREDRSQPMPDLILLDLNLPRMSGFEVLDAIQEAPTLGNRPILVLTSSTSETDVRESYDKCANAYLTKPSDPDAFVAIARAVEQFWFEQVALPPT